MKIYDSKCLYLSNGRFLEVKLLLKLFDYKFVYEVEIKFEFL